MITRSVVSTLFLAPSMLAAVFCTPTAAFGNGGGCGDPQAGNCCQSKAEPFCDDLACCNAVCASDPFCCNSAWDGQCANSARQLCAACQCGGGTEDLFYPFANDGSWSLAIPENGNDDDSSTALGIGFGFDFYGTTYKACFINENGNLTFEGPLSTQENAEFPASTTPMVAAFWTNVFRGFGSTARVWFKQDDADNDGAVDTFVATWENVVGPMFDASRRNTFQIILTDGTHPKLGDGVRVALSYGEMCWAPETTGGGGKDSEGSNPAIPAAVGMVGDDAGEFIVVGRFVPPGISFDGPEGDLDGFDFLDRRLITARLLPNEAPTCTDCPQDGTIFVPQTEPLDRTLHFTGPEPDQSVVLKIMNPSVLAARGVTATVTNGSTASLRLQWSPSCCDDTPVPVVLAATDDFENPAARTIEISLVSVCTIGPDIVPIGGSVPAFVPIGGQAQATWTCRNDGTTDAIGTWSDSVYLSVTPELDENAQFAGFASVSSNGLAPGAEYTRSTVLSAPVGGGNFFVFVVADDFETLCETTGDDRSFTMIGTMQFEGVCGSPQSGNCCVASSVRGCNDEQCCQLVCALDFFCCNNRWDSICASEAQDLCSVCNEPTVCSGNGAELFYPFQNDGSWTPVMTSGNNSSVAVNLPFQFSFFGDTFTTCFVNTNGNITFGGSFTQATLPTFPTSFPKIIAAFLADVDLNSSGSGDIWRKTLDRNGDGSPDTMVFTWDNVGFTPSHRSRLNTFQLIITNGLNPDLEPGANIALSYANMCWTTGDFDGGVDGFGGNPALVGVNRGNNVDAVLLGRFNRNDASYDGPGGETDGIDFLDGRFFQTSIANNIAPVPLDFPSGGSVAIAAGSAFDRTISFSGPEASQTVSLVVANAAALAQRGVVLTTTDGTIATLRVQWTPGCCDAGTVPVQIVATDSAVPAGVATYTLNLIVQCTTAPDLVLSNGSARASATGGASVPVSWTGINAGDAGGSASWIDRVFVSSDAVLSANDIVVGDVAVSSADFAAGTSYQRSLDVVLPNITASRFVLVVGDINDTLCERDGAESSVLAIGPIAITENQPPICTNYPSNGAVSITPESPLDLTLEFLPPEVEQTTTLEVFNAGGILARGATITEVEGNPSTLRLQWTPSCCHSGFYEIVVRATDSMAAPRFQDFPIRITVGCAVAPNLVVTSAIAPTNGFTGQAIAVTWTARNEGTPASNVAWVDRVRIAGAESSNVSVQNSFPVFAAGAQYTRTVAVTLPPTPGTYGIFVEGDINDTLCEPDSEEGSTRHVGDIVVIVPPRPDLVVESVTPISDGVLSGSSVKFSYVVRNNGNAPTAVATWRDLVILSPDAELALPPAPLGVETILLDPTNPQFLLPGESYARNVEVILPRDFSGSRRIAVYTDGSAGAPQGAEFGVAETNEGNNVRFTAPFEVVLEPQPDLKGVSMSVPSTAFSGTSFTINATMENRGEGAADPGVNWRYAIYLSENQTPEITQGDLFLGDRESNIVGLEPNQVRALQTSAQIPITLSGPRFVKLHLDSGNGVSEFGFEGNNVFSSTTPMEIFLSPPVDLVVTAPVVTPSLSFPGHVVRATWQGTNEGAPLLPSQVVQWIDRVFLSNNNALDAGDMLLAERSRNTLDIGPPATLYDYTNIADVRLPNQLAAGNYFLIVQGDATNLFFEGTCEDACESNNIVATPFTVESRFADLVAFDFVAPSAGDASESMTISWKTRNQGEVVTPVALWSDRVRLIGNGVSIDIGGTTRFSALPVGGVYTTAFSVPVPLVPAGTYELVLTADASGQCFEGSNEGNNTLSLPFTVTGAGADLRVETLVAGLEPVSGKPFTVECTIRNVGDRRTPSASWNDMCFLSQDTVLDGGDIQLATRGRGAVLEEGASYGQQCTGTIPLGVIGDFFVIVLTDANNNVFETIETNNALVSASPITVAPPRLPNLSVIAVSRGAAGTAGQPMEVSWTVANDSEFPLLGAQWRDSVYLSLDQFFDVASDVHLGTVVVGDELAPEATYTRTRSFTVPTGLTGAFYVIAVSDSLVQIAEASESDNTGSAASDTDLSLPAPSDLIVANVTTAESELVLGQTYEFARELRNAGDQPISGVWKDSMYLSADNAWSIDDRRIGSFQTVVGAGSPLAPNATITEEGFAEVAGVTPGTYHLIARTDVFNAISETNEANNVGTGLGTVLVRATPIELGVTFNGVQLGNNGSRYFEFDAPAGEPILVEFDHLNDSANIELFVKHGTVPTSGNFDAAGRAPGEPQQQALVPSSRAGKYYVFVRNSGMVGSEAGFTIRASIVPYSVLSVEPSVVGNAGTATFAIEGARFDKFATPILIDSTGRERIPYWLEFESTSRIHVSFDIRGMAAGSCDLRIRSALRFLDLDLATGNFFPVEEVVGEFTAVNALTIVDGGGASVSIENVAPLRVRLGSPFAFNVFVTNNGLNDAPMPVVQVASPDGNPISLNPEGVSAQGFSTQFVGVGGRNPLVLAPGEVVYLPVFARAERTGPARLIVQDLSNDASEIAWPQLEAYYRDESEPEVWDATWSRFLQIVGPTWDTLHRAMRLAASDMSFRTNARVQQGSDVIERLLQHARVGRSDLSGFATVETGVAYSDASRVDEELEGSVAGESDPCSPPSNCIANPQPCPPQNCPAGCEPYNIVEASLAELYLNMFFTSGSVCIDVEVRSAYLDFMKNRQQQGRKMIQETDTDQLRADLEESIELTWAEEDVANTVEKRLTKCLEQSGCESALPANQRVSFPISAYLSECELDPNVDFAGAEQSVIGRICSASKLLLGGGGRGPYSINIQCPPDQRLISANMVLMRVVDDCGSTVRIEASLEDITWRIIDTIDFCPGNLGDGIETDLATRPLCRLEAAGFAFDIGIDLTLNRPNRAFTFKIPKSCTQSCRTQPPGSECAEVCGPNGLAGQCSENGSNDGGKECGGEETVVDVVASFDPNLKTGPQGFGPENWTSAVSPLPYRIDFENLADASAPAGRVVVTDELDPRLNALSVRLGDMMLSGTTVDVPDNVISFQTEVDLIAERGVIVEVTAGVDTSVVPARVFWIFQSIDPATGEAPLDPFLGFLPPEDGSGRGQGFVTCTVRPKSATADGAVIENEAEIVFDANAPILTNLVANTLDRALPSSSVLPLPAVTTDATLLIDVVGSDTAGGSGLSEFRLFMSIDGGPFQSIGASEDGQFVSPALPAGHVYGFASQAVDRAGGVESLPSEPDTVVAVPSINLAAVSDTGVVGDGVTNDPTPTVLVVSAPLSNVSVSIVGRGSPVDATTDALGRASLTVGGSGLSDGTYTVVATSNGVSVSTAIVVDTVVAGELAWTLTASHGDAGPAISVLPTGASFVEPRLGGIAEISIASIGKSPCNVATPTLRIDGNALDGNAMTNVPLALVEPRSDGWLVRFTAPIVESGVYCLTLTDAIDCAGNLRPIDQRRRTFVILPGDATGDRRVNNTDVGGVASLLGTDPIDVRNALHVRSDIDRDGDVDATDLAVVLAERGKDARFIVPPCPAEPASGGVLVSDGASGSSGGADPMILSPTSRPTEGGVAAANAEGEDGLDSSDPGTDELKPLVRIAIEALPGLDAELLQDTERFSSIAPWGDGSWWIAEVPAATLEHLASGALDTTVAFSSPVRSIDDVTLAFDGRDVIAVVEDGKLQSAARRIREEIPVIDSLEVIGAHDGQSFLRLATRLPDGPSVRELAVALVDRGLVIAASPEVHFVTAVDAIGPQVAGESASQLPTLDSVGAGVRVAEVLASLAEVPSSVVILGGTDSVEVDLVVHEAETIASAEQRVSAPREPKMTTIATYSILRTEREMRVFGRSSWQVQSLLKTIRLDPSVVIDLAHAAPRSRIVQMLWMSLREAPARDARTTNNGVDDEARTDWNVPGLQAK